jgi:hypothetical protein
MFHYQHLQSPYFNSNRKKANTEFQGCIICGKECKKPKYWVWEHLGGGTLVTEEESENLNKNGRENADVGCWPIGSDCLKKNPEIKPYIVGTPDWAKK